LAINPSGPVKSCRTVSFHVLPEVGGLSMKILYNANHFSSSWSSLRFWYWELTELGRAKRYRLLALPCIYIAAQSLQRYEGIEKRADLAAVSATEGQSSPSFQDGVFRNFDLF
jgi:hypothetical protein